MRPHHSLPIVALTGVIVAMNASAAGPPLGFRPPAVPLVAHDPYFSIWSCADRLTDDVTRHWTRRPHSLVSLVRIDGHCYRVMGSEPADVPALEQTRVTVLPTRTIYQFEGGGVHLSLTFLSAALPNDLERLSRPVTYIAWEFRSVDEREHKAEVYFEASAEPAVDEPSQQARWARESSRGLRVVRVGTVDQPVLQKRGDDRRIDWGWLYVAASSSECGELAIALPAASRARFAADGAVPATFDEGPHPAAGPESPVLAVALSPVSVSRAPCTRWLMVAYDQVRAIRYFGEDLRPYWRSRTDDPIRMLEAAAHDYPTCDSLCAKLDRELMADLASAGGSRYAAIGALAYRQCLAGNMLAADSAGEPLMFPKENTSNGCIGTVDVIYPMAPLFLLTSPSLARAMLVPILDYASSERWRFPFAPHDLGTYPQATAQVYGGGERTEENQMPVEESANMLILLAAIAEVEGNADFAAHYRPVLERWAGYLREKGFDPENQLCTDDFAGHLAHNVNLSAKAIIAMGAYAKLCAEWGDTKSAEDYRALAREDARKWVQLADDGDHFRLALDRQGTWSQKYNLVWDRILGLGLFPPEVLRKEMDYYLRTRDRYGLALDSRQPYAKTDWSLWTATLTGERADFDALVEPVYDYLHTTPDRVPLNDLYWTKTGRECSMHARPVVGGVFLRLLHRRDTWRKWASRDLARASNWAPFPKPPKITHVVPSSEQSPVAWRWTTGKPLEGWFLPDFSDAAWAEGQGGFGTRGTPGAVARTEWSTPDIWLRREFSLSKLDWHDPQLWVHHDEDAEVYLNGVLAASLSGYSVQYDAAPIAPAARAALVVGRNVLAVRCHQTTGGQYIDVGIVDVEPGY